MQRLAGACASWELGKNTTVGVRARLQNHNDRPDTPEPENRLAVKTRYPPLGPYYTPVNDDTIRRAEDGALRERRRHCTTALAATEWR